MKPTRFLEGGRENRTSLPDPTPKTNKKLNDKMLADVETFFKAGLSEASIAGVVGVTYQTLCNWLIRGMNDAGNGYESEYRELFERAAKARGTNELQFIHKLRELALGKPKEFEYNETTAPDGTVTKTVALDGKGNPIVKAEEVKPDPYWVAWYLERKFHKVFGRKDKDAEDSSILGSTAISNNSGSQRAAPVPLTKAERLQMIEIYKERVLKDVEPTEKEADEQQG